LGLSLRTGIGWRDESDAEQWEMKIGDRIRIIELPNGLTNDDALQTKNLFERCLGRWFPIAAIIPVKENNTQLLELEVVGRQPQSTRFGSSLIWWSLSRWRFSPLL